ncbi:14219_t:CDS:10 [Gigaspora margarita]|uniref:14219_t:CDS:1 n=1 Tax=Gigaspora margarita TaxID=4874 RepID=A0ABN7UMH8_GIGMA|nr:14219_t:CDS:10 [Gigaspora margarita]
MSQREKIKGYETIDLEEIRTADRKEKEYKAANDKIAKLEKEKGEQDKIVETLTKKRDEVQNELQKAKDEIKKKDNDLEVIKGDYEIEEQNVVDKNNEIGKLKDQITELEDKNAEKLRLILELEKRPTQEDYNGVVAERDKRPNIRAEVDLAVNEARQQEADKYKDYIAPDKFAEVARQKGYKGKDEVDAEVANETKKYEKHIHPDNLENEAKKAVAPATYRADWINPNELETKAKAKGMISAEEHNRIINEQKEELNKKIGEADTEIIDLSIKLGHADRDKYNSWKQGYNEGLAKGRVETQKISDEKQELEDKLEEKDRKIEDLTISVNIYKEVDNKLEENRKQLNDEKTAHQQTQLEKAQTEKDQHEGTKKELDKKKAELETKKQEIVELERVAEIFTSKIKELRIEKEQLELELKEAKSQAKEDESTIRDLENEVIILERDSLNKQVNKKRKRGDLQHKLKTQKKEIQQKEKNNEIYCQQNNEIVELKEKSALQVNELNQQIKELQDDKEILQYFLELAEQDQNKSQAKVKELAEQLADSEEAKKTYQQTTIELEALQKRYKKIEAELQAVSEKLQQVNNNNFFATEENKELARKLGRQEKLNQKQGQKITKLENQLKEVKKELDKDKYIESEAQVRFSQWEAERKLKKAETELAALKQKLEQEKENHQETANKLNERTENNSDLQKRISELERKCRELQIQLKAEREEKKIQNEAAAEEEKEEVIADALPPYDNEEEDQELMNAEENKDELKKTPQDNEKPDINEERENITKKSNNYSGEKTDQNPELQQIKDFSLQQEKYLDDFFTNLENILGLTVLPDNYSTLLAKKADLDQARQQVANLTTERDNEKVRADTFENDLLTEFNITNLADLKKRPLQTDYDNIKNQRDSYQQQRDNLQNKLDTHQCAVVTCQEPCCQGDYERLQKKLTTQKKQILQKINNSLELGLSSRELSLKKVISRIEELLRKPLTDNQKLQKELTQAQKTIELLKKQLAEKDPDYNAIQQAEYRKILQLVKNDTYHSCEKLGIVIPQPVKENINQATTIERVLAERNSLLQGKLTHNDTKLKMITRNQEKLIHEQEQER